jgi:hypothetical protein
MMPDGMEFTDPDEPPADHVLTTTQAAPGKGAEALRRIEQLLEERRLLSELDDYPE